MARKSSVVVEQDPDAPVEKAVLAQAIVDISKASKRLAENGLNEKAVIVLLKHETGIPMSKIEAVLSGLKTLAQVYCKR